MEKGEDEMLAIRNFGKKSLDELVDKLREKNYLNVPGVDLTTFFAGSSSSGEDDEEADDLAEDEQDEVNA
jgi:DNA-directed RNA polymerase subunit alpha